MKAWRALFLLILFWAVAARAHEVHHRIESVGAVSIALSYANGEPFAYEKYALYPAGQEMPTQVGNTDAAGRVVFIPGTMQKWRLHATSADGHGVNLEFSAPAVAATASAPPAATEQSRWLLAGFGLALIFGLFGLAQLFINKRRLC